MSQQQEENREPQQENQQQLRGERWRQFKTAFVNWLETGRLSVGWQIGIGIFLFLAGAVGQHLLQVGLGKLSDDIYANVWILILLFAVAAIALTITATVLLSGLKAIIDRFKEDQKDAKDTIGGNQEVILGRVDRNHDAILRVLNSLSSRFMLEVELIPDSELTYERAKELLRKPKKV